MSALPQPIERLLDAALVAELTVVDSTGRPVTYPLIPLYDGERIYMTSSTLFSKKLEHIKQNPRVAVSLSDPVAMPAPAGDAAAPGAAAGDSTGSTGSTAPSPSTGTNAAGQLTDRATIQGDARIIEDDPHGGWERLLPLWERKEPSIVTFLKARVALPLFFERALIEIVPRRAMYWPDGETDRPPQAFDLTAGTPTGGHAPAEDQPAGAGSESASTTSRGEVH